MSDMALFLGVAAMLCAAYALHGGWLAGRWGVDPSRQTLACHNMMNQGRRWGAAPAVFFCVLASLWPAIWIYICTWEPDSMIMSFVVCSLCTVVCGVFSFAALFICVRTGDDLAHAAGEELFPEAEKMMHALSALNMIASAGAVVTLRYALAGTGVVLWHNVVLWLSLGVMMASQRMASGIRSEGHMQKATYGGAVCTGVLALAWCVSRIWKNPETESVTDWLPLIFAAAAAACVLVCLGADAIRGLLKSPLPKKEKVPPVLWTLFSAVASVALGVAGGRWLIPLSGIAGTGYLLLAAITCTKWFHRIGRGLFSGH